MYDRPQSQSSLYTPASLCFIGYIYVIALYFCIYYASMTFRFEASRGAAARGVTVKPTACGFDPHSRG